MTQLSYSRFDSTHCRCTMFNLRCC